MGLKILITGATGMLGGGVLRECLDNDDVSSVVSLSRSSVNISSPKLMEILLPDFSDLSSVEDKLSGFDACFYCLGTTSNGMSEQDYRKITLDLTLVFAQKILKLNPEGTFTFVSAEGSDPNGKSMWARVKGEAEQAVLNLGFKKAFIFRPAVTYPDNGVEIRSKSNRFAMYIIKPLYPILKRLLPNMVTTTSRFGRAMINVSKDGFDKNILGCKEINQITGQV